MCNFFCLITPLGCLPFALVPPRLASSENDFERRALLGGVGLGPYVQFISTWVVGVSWIVDSVDWAKSCSNWYGKYSMIYSYFLSFHLVGSWKYVAIFPVKTTKTCVPLEFFPSWVERQKTMSTGLWIFQKDFEIHWSSWPLCIYIYLFIVIRMCIHMYIYLYIHMCTLNLFVLYFWSARLQKRPCPIRTSVIWVPGIGYT